ncbi:MAG TPA: hypothetical protein VFP96_11405 [Candidatus Acidoferrum sp.]|nr:hypothetical protein [Candidatus Acidoferrum sp.]
MKTLPCVLAIGFSAFAAAPTEKISRIDSVRVREFYRLADKIQNEVWPGWNAAPAPVLLVTPTSEFLTHHPDPPKEFADAGDGFLARLRQFPVQLEATFPAFGPPSVIVIGAPETTASKSSTPWLFVVMHEHFHQLQDMQPELYKKVEALGLSHGDTSGMWMLNYPFPYEKPGAVQGFAALRDLLLKTLAEKDEAKFNELAREYVEQRRTYFAQFSADDRKYFEFELWKEGIARYTQVKCAEAAANYQPTPEFAALPDYESFASVSAKARTATLSELQSIRLNEAKRTVVYSFGAAEGFLLDRLRPDWKTDYFKHLFKLSDFFE